MGNCNTAFQELTEDVLDEYAELTFLTKAEIISLFRTWQVIKASVKNMRPIFSVRIPFEDIAAAFPHLMVLLALSALSAGTVSGGVFAFTSILFAQEKTLQLSTDQQSWLASIFTMLSFPACLSSGPIMEIVGRRSLLRIGELLSLSSWILVYFSFNFTMHLCARILSGIYLGMAYPTFITYMGEVSNPQYRTIFLPTLTVGQAFGTFICQFLGEYITYKIVALIFCCFPIYNLLSLFFLKESYVTYLDRNNISTAKENYEWFRGDSIESKKEFDDLLEEKNKKKKRNFKELLQMCQKKAFIAPLGIATLVFLTNELTGTLAVIAYTSQIISMIKDDAVFSYYATLTLNILRIMAVVLSLLMVKLSSVRFILITTGYLLGLSLVSLGLTMFLAFTYRDNTMYPILSLVFLVLNTVLFGIGLGPLPSVVCGEIFPQETRSIGGSISAAISFFFLFIVIKLMPFMFAGVGSYGTFWIMGGLTFVGIAASQYFLPNTKNKTLQEINKLYQE